METAESVFEELVGRFAGEGVVGARMFGKRSLNRGGKAFACLHGDDLAVKLGAGTGEHAAALALSGARLFDPSGAHRPMKDWVAVPVEHAGRWPDLVASGLARLPG